MISFKADDYKIYKSFIHQNLQMKPKKKENDDVLSKAPLRLLAYSNEVGAAISPMNKTLGTVLWAPALLYLGADIYDKYKNEDKVYNPSAKRSVKQAVFQGLASVILPSTAISLGQKIGVHVTKNKEALSATDKKELVEFTSNFLESGDFLDSNNEDFSKSLINNFIHKAKANEIKIKSRNVFQKFGSIFSENTGYEYTFNKYLKNPTSSNPVIAYLERQGKTVCDILSDEKNIQAEKYIRFFNSANKKFNNINLARKETALKLLKDKNINKSIVATISGFIALILLAKPIDYFVENILMEKVIDPIIDKFSKNKKQETEKEETVKKA